MFIDLHLNDFEIFKFCMSLNVCGLLQAYF